MHPWITIATNIQLLRSSVSNKRPDPEILLEGQAAVNLSADKSSAGLYFTLSNGHLTKIGPVGINPIEPPNALPAGSPGNAVGEEWLDTSPNFFQPVQKTYNGQKWLTTSGFLVDGANGDFTLLKTMYLRTLEVSGKGPYSYIRVPQDDHDSKRAITPAAGMFRFNNDEQTLKFEGHDGSRWIEFATSTGKTTLEDVEILGDVRSFGNVDLCTDCTDDFRVRGRGLFDCEVAIRKALSVTGNGIIQGQSVILNSNLADETSILGSLQVGNTANLKRSLIVGSENPNGNTATIACDTFLLNDAQIGASDQDALLVKARSAYDANATFAKDVIIGTNVNSELYVKASARFVGNVEIGVQGVSNFLNIYSTPIYHVDAFFNESVQLGSNAADNLTVNATAELKNNVTIGTALEDQLVVNSTALFAADVRLTENVEIGDSAIQTLNVNAYSHFKAGVELGTLPTQQVHIKATPSFFTDALPAANLGSNLGNASTRWNNIWAKDGYFAGKLTAKEFVVDDSASFLTDIELGYDELHDLTVNSTTIFKAGVGFENDVIVGQDSSRFLEVRSTTQLYADTTIGINYDNRGTTKLDVFSTPYFFTNVYPDGDLSVELGSPTLRWKKVHALDASFQGSVDIGSICENDTLNVNAVTTFNCPVTIHKDVTFNDGCGGTTRIKGTLYADCDVYLTSQSNQKVTTEGSLEVKGTGNFTSDVVVNGSGTVKQEFKALGAVILNVPNGPGTDIVGAGLNVDNNFNANRNGGNTGIFGNLTAHKNVALNTSPTDTTKINGILTAYHNVTLNTDCTELTLIKGKLNSVCDVTLNSTCEDSTLIKGVLTANCDVTLNANGGQTETGTIVPLNADCTYDLGSPTLRWANVYSCDLQLSNMQLPNGNDVDGTKGDWTLQEGADNLYVINNLTGKKFKISLEAV